MSFDNRKSHVGNYEEHREKMTARERADSASVRDIGDLPAVKHPRRKSRAGKSLRYFLESYFPETFFREWSDDHLFVISKIEEAVRDGGLFDIAMPRGFGKSSICECGAIWAELYGFCNYVALIGSDEPAADSMLNSIKTELEVNEALAEDFPEVCFPIAKMEGIHNRASGQTFHGERTCIHWKSGELVLPTIPGSRASGAITTVAGITGRIRGMKFKRRDGRTARPQLVLIDDPQTDESARSEQQCNDRESVFQSAILGLAGKGRRISALAAVTVIAAGDLSSRLLDHARHPEWQGHRTKMIYAWPTNDSLWQKYAEVWRESLDAGTGIAPATEFYRQHKREMDSGAKVAWEQDFDEGELSALQHAWNLRLMMGEAAFMSECQNDPLPPENIPTAKLTSDAVCKRINGLARGVAPLSSEHLTAFIDVHDDLLFWIICGWASDFTGAIIDYGVFPEQRIGTGPVRKTSRTLSACYPAAGKPASVRAGLVILIENLLGRTISREDGVGMRIEKLLVDSRYDTQVVNEVCRRSRQGGLILPAMGVGIGAKHTPMMQHAKKERERFGWHWIIGPTSDRATRYIRHDANYWKTAVTERLLLAVGERGAITIFGKTQNEHHALADQITSERPVSVTARGRTVDEWSLLPGRTDNHWLDCLTGSAVAASVCGSAIIERQAKQKAGRVSYAQLQRKAKNKERE